MITVIGVRFRKAGKVYYFDPCDVWPRTGEYVVVETARGPELGEVVTGARQITDDAVVQPLKKVLRAALPEDLQTAEINAQKEKEAFPICQEQIKAHGLEMKLVDVEYTFDNSKIIFYFTADGRVDFRELVKDLASVFKMRIELRQIGVRDEARMLGGLGACGRTICCAAFLGDFQPLSIKMAKEQNLSLNPVKISGQCGRLMCCLRYEQSYYEEMIKKMPRVNAEVVTPDGIGTVSEIFVVREKVRVRIRGNDDTYDVREYDLEDIHRPGHAPVPKEFVCEAAKTEEKAEPEVPVEAEEPRAVETEAVTGEKEKEVRRSPRGRYGRRNDRRKDKAEQPADSEKPADPGKVEIAGVEKETAEPSETESTDEGKTEAPHRRRHGKRHHHRNALKTE